LDQEGAVEGSAATQGAVQTLASSTFCGAVAKRKLEGKFKGVSAKPPKDDTIYLTGCSISLQQSTAYSRMKR